MSEKITQLLKEVNIAGAEKRYHDAIKYGLELLRYPISQKLRNDLYINIAGFYYKKGDNENYNKWVIRWLDTQKDRPYGDVFRTLSNYLFVCHLDPNITDDELARRHFKAQDFVADVPWICDDDVKKEWASKARNNPHRKLKIGYISSDFARHVCVHFFIQLLGIYDKSRFEVHCYNMCHKFDGVTENLKEYVDYWDDVQKLSFEQIAEKIYEDKIDILVDLSVHAGNSKTLCVAAHKPAPIIVSCIGYMSTSGIKAVDYFLTDVYCDPPGMGDELFAEKLVRLPHSHFTYTPAEMVLLFEPNTKIHDDIVFGSLNNLRKINDQVLAVWKRIIDRVPKSRIVLQSMSTDVEREEMAKRMIKCGFDMERVELRPPTGIYYKDYNDIDICLDPYPYVGGGSTCDAVYMGVPVVSRYGTRHGTRFGYSLLMNMGLDGLVADTWEKYEEIAVALANDRELLTMLHENLRTIMQQSNVMNYRQYVREIEAAYMNMWQEFISEN